MDYAESDWCKFEIHNWTRNAKDSKGWGWIINEVRARPGNSTKKKKKNLKLRFIVISILI